MSTDTNTLDALIRHQIFLLRRGGGINNELNEILETMRANIVTRLERGATQFQTARLSLLLNDLNEIIDSSITEYGEQLILKLEDLTEYETGFIQRLMNANTSANFALPAPSLVQSIVTNTQMQLQSGSKIQRMTISDMISNFALTNKRQVSNTLKAGVLSGESSGEIVRSIKRLVSKRTQAQAYAIVRTATNTFTSEARDLVYRENGDVIEGLEWVSVLDSHTTLECARRDGIVYPLDDHPPIPRHWNCRSLYSPKVADEFSLPITGGTRASVNGPVNALSTYQGWIKKQPASFQDEFLGKARGKLFRQGNLKLDKFVDDAGRPYTLDQLRQLEPLAFERANL